MESCPMLCGSLDGRGVWGRTDTCICMAETLPCSLEIITTLFISYTSKQNKKVWFFFNCAGENSLERKVKDKTLGEDCSWEREGGNSSQKSFRGSRNLFLSWVQVKCTGLLGTLSSSFWISHWIWQPSGTTVAVFFPFLPFPFAIEILIALL